MGDVLRVHVQPAASNWKAMCKEMPRTLGDDAGDTVFPQLLRGCAATVEEMVKRNSRTASAKESSQQVAISSHWSSSRTPEAPRFPAAKAHAAQLREAAKTCAAATILHATQVVFGEGAAGATVMLWAKARRSGRRQGKPFVVARADNCLQVLEEVGIDRRHDVYVTTR